MEELLIQLKRLGFTENYLKTIKEQNLPEVVVPNIDNVKYSTYDSRVNYNTQLFYSENK